MLANANMAQWLGGPQKINPFLGFFAFRVMFRVHAGTKTLSRHFKQFERVKIPLESMGFEPLTLGVNQNALLP